MKKLLLIATAIMIANFASAQKINWGLKLRYTDAKLNLSANGISVSQSGLNNVDGGVFAEVNYNSITFQPGLLFVLKGGGLGQFTLGSTGGGYTQIYSEMRLTKLELPLNVLYNIPFKTGKVFLGGGPFVDYALSGKTKAYTTQYSASGMVTNFTVTDQAATFGGADGQVNRFDAGLNWLAGVRLNYGFELTFGMDFGLTNVVNSNSVKSHNQTWSAGIGYFLK